MMLWTTILRLLTALVVIVETTDGFGRADYSNYIRNADGQARLGTAASMTSPHVPSVKRVFNNSPVFNHDVSDSDQENDSRGENTPQKRQSSGPNCGPSANGAKCTNNQCCSQFGYCGTGDVYCLLADGCQPAYGSCQGSSSSTTTTTTSSTSSTSSTSTISPSPSPTGLLTVSTNGMCGNSTTCAGFSGGQCCSEYWYCGNGPAWCGTGCNPSFGTCGGSGSSNTTSTTTTRTSTTSTTTTSTSTSSTSPAATIPAGQSATTDGTCGNGKSCLAWSRGTCCSQYGYCGESSLYCSPVAGCQPTFGTCSAS